MKTLAQQTLIAGLEDEAYGQTDDILVYGNTLGVELIKERDDYRSKQEVLTAKVEGLNTKVSLLEDSKEELYGKIRDLSKACNGYLIIRHRFLDTFRRDILKEKAWTPMIQAGNAVAHDGDAITDASLYETNSRKDKSLMHKIYGLSAEQIRSLSKYLSLFLMLSGLHSI
jgi:hypothetical protein